MYERYGNPGPVETGRGARALLERFGVAVRRLGDAFRLAELLAFFRPEVGRLGGGVLAMSQSYQLEQTFNAWLAYRLEVRE